MFETLGTEEKAFIELVHSYARAHPQLEHHFIDVGGASAVYTEYVRQTFYDIETRCHVFEPHPAAADLLRSKYSDVPQVVVNHAAVSNFDGIAPFVCVHDDWEKSHLERAKSPEPGEAQVEVVTLDSYWHKNRWPITLLKIDTEGNELNVLDGAQELLSSRRVLNLQFEYGGTWIGLPRTLRDVVAELREFGYDVFRYSGAFDKVTPDDLVEDYLYQNYFAASRT